MKVTSKENGTIDNEPAVRILGDGINLFSGIKFMQYLVWHDKKPYALAYMANVKDYEKYLPQFELMVKTFKFANKITTYFPSGVLNFKLIITECRYGQNNTFTQNRVRN